jgi:hypothetical protein
MVDLRNSIAEGTPESVRHSAEGGPDRRSRLKFDDRVPFDHRHVPWSWPGPDAFAGTSSMFKDASRKAMDLPLRVHTGLLSLPPSVRRVLIPRFKS